MGYLKLPDEVTEYDWSNPEFQKFTKPVVIRGGCKEMPAFKKWNLEYMKKVFGDTKIETNVFTSLKKMQTFNPHRERYYKINFLKLSKLIFNKEPPFYYPANWYLNKNIEYDNKLIQDCKHTSDEYRKVIDDKPSISFFMGNNTYTGSHLHIFKDFFVNVLVGKKIFYMWSFIDNQEVNLEKFHLTHYHNQNFWKRDHSKMKIYKVELNAGDSLLLPPWWYHAVYSPGFCIGIAKVYTRGDIPNINSLDEYEKVNIRSNLDKIFNLKKIQYFTDKKINIKIIIIIVFIFLLVFVFKFKRISNYY